MLHRLRQLFTQPEPVLEEVPIFSVPEGIRVYAVGDIHGRHHLLQKMLHAIVQDASKKPDAQIVEIFLGDYIDRGMHSREVIDLLLTPSPKNHERVCLLGNHEETLLRFLEDPKILRDWANYGGYATLASYGIPIPGPMSPGKLIELRDRFRQNLPATHATFFKGLKLTYTVGNYLFVHAGVQPKIPLTQQAPDQLLWIRDAFLKYEGFFEYYVVHGHSPVTAPDIRSNRTNLDITDAPMNSLCCLVLENTERNILVITDEND